MVPLSSPPAYAVSGPLNQYLHHLRSRLELIAGRNGTWQGMVEVRRILIVGNCDLNVAVGLQADADGLETAQPHPGLRRLKTGSGDGKKLSDSGARIADHIARQQRRAERRS